MTCLSEARMERVVVLDSVDSTNRYLVQMAHEGAPDGQVVIANSQTAGRGRLSRSFHSPEGMGVYFSYLIRPEQSAKIQENNDALQSGAVKEELSPAAWTKVTSMTAVAVSDAVEVVCGVRPRIKWVNDLYLGEKKICGILTQMDTEPGSGQVRSIVIGVGVNVHHKTEDFPEEIRDVAGSLLTETGKHIPRMLLASEMTRAMDRMRASIADPDGHYLARYREASMLPGTDVTVISGDVQRTAKALSIEDDYALRVRYDDGTEECLRGGEVSIRRTG